MRIIDEAKNIQQHLVDLRRWFHSHPEIGHDLTNTRARVLEELDALGISHEYVKNGGILGFLGKPGGKRILLRADMDALPMQEETGLPFASENPGKMHACGHDMHITMLLGAAHLLKAHEDELDGQVILCFQEAEEVMLGGAIDVVSSDLLKPFPDHTFAMHVFPEDCKESGTLVCTEGTFMTSCDVITVTVEGVACHGSTPHKGINPILVAMHLIQSFTDLMRYELDPQLPAVLTIGKISAGTAFNIIPSTCTFAGSLRMVSEERRAFVKRRLQQISSGTEEAFNVKIDLRFEGLDLVHNDPAFVHQVHGWLTDESGLLVENVGTHFKMVSEDFCEFCNKAPSAMFGIVSKSPEGQHYPLHNSHVIFDEDILYQGSTVFTKISLQYLKQGS